MAAEVRSGSGHPVYGRGGALLHACVEDLITHHAAPEQSKPPMGWAPQQ
jgi:hypothetical protein